MQAHSPHGTELALDPHSSSALSPPGAQWSGDPPAVQGDWGSIPGLRELPWGRNRNGVLAWKAHGQRGPGGLQFTGSQRSQTRLSSSHSPSPARRADSGAQVGSCICGSAWSSQGMPVLLRKVVSHSQSSHIFDVTSGYFCKIPADLCPTTASGPSTGLATHISSLKPAPTSIPLGGRNFQACFSDRDRESPRGNCVWVCLCESCPIQPSYKHTSKQRHFQKPN